MDVFANLWLGFTVAFTLQNLFYAFVGCILGTLIGVLPGIGPVATIAMLLPITFNLNPTGALSQPHLQARGAPGAELRSEPRFRAPRERCPGENDDCGISVHTAAPGLQPTFQKRREGAGTTSAESSAPPLATPSAAPRSSLSREGRGAASGASSPC